MRLDARDSRVVRYDMDMRPPAAPVLRLNALKGQGRKTGTKEEHERFDVAAATSAVPRGRRCSLGLRVVRREEPFSIHGHSRSTGV